jgi:hypothetical protein
MESRDREERSYLITDGEAVACEDLEEDAQPEECGQLAGNGNVCSSTVVAVSLDLADLREQVARHRLLKGRHPLGGPGIGVTRESRGLQRARGVQTWWQYRR